MRRDSIPTDLISGGARRFWRAARRICNCSGNPSLGCFAVLCGLLGFGSITNNLNTVALLPVVEVALVLFGKLLVRSSGAKQSSRAH